MTVKRSYYLWFDEDEVGWKDETTRDLVNEEDLARMVQSACDAAHEREGATRVCVTISVEKQNPQPCDGSGVLDYGISTPPCPGCVNCRKPEGPRTCNRHDDCDAADGKARAAGKLSAEHCRDDTCEDCFGQ